MDTEDILAVAGCETVAGCEAVAGTKMNEEI